MKVRFILIIDVFFGVVKEFNECSVKWIMSFDSYFSDVMDVESFCIGDSSNLNLFIDVLWV